MRLVLLACVGCRIANVDATGKACPCPPDLVCVPATNTCEHSLPTDAMRDAPDAAVTYRDVVLADHPLAYWRLGDAGPTAKDEMGMYDGTYSGNCTLGATGALAHDADTAVKFDGSTCMITLPDALAFPGTAPFSVEAWVFVSVQPNTFRLVFTKESRSSMGPIDGYALVDSTTGVYGERAIGMSTMKTPNTLHAIGQYIHLVMVYDGAAIGLYIDTVPTATKADTRLMPTFSAAAIIGNDSTSDPWAGSIDEVAIYDHALTPERIKLHHDMASQ